MLSRSSKIPSLPLAGMLAGAIGLTMVCACTQKEGDGMSLSTSSQAVDPTAYDVMADADTVPKYADKCGLGTDAAATQLPALGTAGTPIRGTRTPGDVGSLVSNGWKLIQSFNAADADLATSAELKANLWHKRVGGRDWYYLYRFTDPDPTVRQRTLNGILGYNATSICAFDRIYPAPGPGVTGDFPPAALTDLYFAGQVEGADKMDDCSDCHVQGYNAPRAKTFAVAKGPDGPTKNPLKWIGPWKAYAAAFGPQWKLGKAPTDYKWVSGQGTDLLTTDDSCKGCHGTKWIKPRKPDAYCDTVFAPAFDTNGSMLKQGNKFGAAADCTAFVNAIGCDATAICATAVAAAPPPPRVNETTLLVGDVRAINSTTVQITPMQNPDNLWIAGSDSAIGDHWVAYLQVWGAPYSGGPTPTSPMTSIIPVPDPDALSPILVTGLTPNTQYVFQLNTTDGDDSTAFSPTVVVTTPPGDGTIDCSTVTVCTLDLGDGLCHPAVLFNVPQAETISGTFSACDGPGCSGTCSDPAQFQYDFQPGQGGVYLTFGTEPPPGTRLSTNWVVSSCPSACGDHQCGMPTCSVSAGAVNVIDMREVRVP